MRATEGGLLRERRLAKALVLPNGDFGISHPDVTGIPFWACSVKQHGLQFPLVLPRRSAQQRLVARCEFSLPSVLGRAGLRMTACGPVAVVTLYPISALSVCPKSS
jgi:hypothetical protein